MVNWITPSFPFYKLNIDGSSVGNPGPAGGGIVLRDFFGNVVVAKAEYFGTGTCLFAELKALLLGLQHCH